MYDCLKDLEFSSALDIFGGSGCVSYMFKQMGKRVTYNDMLHFNYLIGKALIENDCFKLDEDRLLRSFDQVKPHSGRIVETLFKDYYFTDGENQWIDRMVGAINGLRGGAPGSLPYVRAIGYYALFQSCLVKRPFNLFHRKNLYLRFANVERSFGNKTTWDTPIDIHFSRFLAEINGAIINGSQRCNATNHHAQEFPNEQYDLIYIDPPYITRGADNSEMADYLRYYHFLEGLANYHRWSDLIDENSTILALKETKENAFRRRNQNQDALKELFYRFRNSIIVVSYKKYGTPSIEWMKKHLQAIGKHVACHSRRYVYALNHQNGDAAKNREVLIIAS